MSGWITKNKVRIYIQDDEFVEEESTLKSELIKKYAQTILPTIYVDSDEYRVICSNIHDNYKNRYKNRKVINVTTANYSYIIELRGYDKFRIVGKEKLK